MHVDFLSEKKNIDEECYFVKKRTEELIRTKNPGEYLVFNEVAPLDSTDAFTFHISETYQRLTCQHNHASAVCRCHMPLYHIGQDESVYHAHSIQSEAWCVDSVQPLRKKNEGNVNRICVCNLIALII